jgi:tripartite-type tricarboxylate transporter receptor subunit TctC
VAHVVSLSTTIVLCFISVGYPADYPTKPINFIVSVTAGGPSDVHARLLADAGSKELGVPIVVTNKGGAGGALAATYVSNEKPDGYTLLVTQSGTMTSNFALFPNLTYKRADFVPLFRSILVPCNFAVRMDSPLKTFQDFINLAKSNPGKVRLGLNSANIGLIWEGISKHEGIDVTSLMYKGAADSLYALVGGHVDILADPLTAMEAHIKAGKIRLLASISSKRNKNYPDVPTLYELGYHEYARDFWNGFYAPAGAPQPIADRFVQAFERVMSQPAVLVGLEKIGVLPGFMGPKEFSNLIDEEYRFYTGLGKLRHK